MGQFGSLADMMSYSVRNHTAFVSASFEPREGTGLFLNMTFNDGRGSMGNINLDPTLLTAGSPAGFDYRLVSEIGRYSALSIGRTQQMVGVNQMIAPGWTLSVVGYLANYKDRQPYLFDADGRTAGVHMGINYAF